LTTRRPPRINGTSLTKKIERINMGTNGTLERTTFTTSRLLEFFTDKELTMQIGHGRNLWPIALLKELIDNALDACEVAEVAPQVRVAVEPDLLTVEDNGPGIPPSVVDRSLDYLVRVSDKSYYVSPTRGQLGNALKCLWAAAFVATGEPALVEVSTPHAYHRIEVGLDRIEQQPSIRHVPSAAVVQTGTLVRLHWPGIACYLTGTEGHDLYNAFALLAAYTSFNPHATFILREPDDDADLRLGGTSPQWQKWPPHRPTDPHWYTPERLSSQLAAYISHEREGGEPRTVREFVSEFHGLRRTATQTEVCKAAGLHGAYLNDLVRDGDVDRGASDRLLLAMQQAARPVKPKALGVLGEQVLVSCLASPLYNARADSVRYKAVAGEAEGVPFVLEVALGIHEEGEERGREVINGVNWSPALRSVFQSLPWLLGEARVDYDDPVTVLVHLAYPRPEYTDRGKGQLVPPAAIKGALCDCVKSVAKRWREAKRRADREGRMRRADLERLRKAQQAKQLSIKQAAYRVMADAYRHASGDGKDPANARQIMYAARRRVLELTGGKCWKNSSYFTQRLLPDFVEANPELTAKWDVVYDSRGRLIEPHTGRRADLGTLQVRNYVLTWTGHCPDRPSISVDHDCPTSGPANRYRFALFIEKEGFYPLLERYRIADRFDLAIMSSKGMSVTAARRLVDDLAGQGVTVLVLRDFDKAGFSIVHTLRTDSRRYRFRNRPRMIDLGLRLSDVRELGLQSEPVEYRGKKDPRENLRARGATEEECDFLVSRGDEGGGWAGERVELNAATSPQLMGMLEHKLTDVGAKKVVPEGKALQSAYHRACRLVGIQEAIDRACDEAKDTSLPDLPADMAARIAKAIEGTDQSWDDALWKLVRDAKKKNKPGKGKK
jgi:DNA topoisomerase VI subunit B